MFLIAGGVGINPLASIYLHIFDLISKSNSINQSIYIKNLDKDRQCRKENLGRFLSHFPPIESLRKSHSEKNVIKICKKKPLSLTVPVPS